MTAPRHDIPQILRQYAKDLKRQRAEAAAMLAELAETSPAQARPACLALPAYHDDDGSSEPLALPTAGLQRRRARGPR